MHDWKVVRFFSCLFRKLLNLVLKHFPEEPVKALLKTGDPNGEIVPEYISKAFEDNPAEYLTPYQISLYHPLAKEKPKKAMRETVYELEKLFHIGCLKISDLSLPLRKVKISSQLYTSLEQELRLSVREEKERFGLLHGYIHGETAQVEEITDTESLKEKGLFKMRDATGMNLAVKAYQVIVKKLDKYLSLKKQEVIGTYHTHLIPYRCSPSLNDSALLMANPGIPHLIICGQGIFAYTFKCYRKIFLTFLVKTPLEIIVK
ncbi:MAG: hypothetical protein OEZ31_02865 [Nitrospirota bacterium]|nr:hypothetical protein [Nitrospirota bacterium]